MPPEIRSQSKSADGAYEIRVSMREIFNSHWLETPTLIDVAAGTTVWTVVDDMWSLDTAAWDGAVVTLTMRKYPGNHSPADLTASVDCVSRTARLGDATVPLTALEQALEGALTWQFAKAAPAPENLLTRLQRFLRGGQ